MSIKSFGTTNLEDIEKVEKELGFKLPQDYKTFLLDTNGGINSNYELSFRIKELNDNIVIDVIFGIDVDENANILSVTKSLAGEMHPNSILIGDSIQHGFIVMICTGANKGIYYWDESYIYDISNDECNMYKIANDFREFLEILTPLD